ncbi:MAG: hypothetical protein KJ666_05165 [Bacteroidetes bacterium]|nr:hypothetical protein [Bacteroidota bacterium]MBU2585991.1 hypothetical protein [Bacteroidota bacterium]
METTEFITELLQLPPEWEVNEINFTEESARMSPFGKSQKKEVHISIRYTDDEGVCRETGEICPIYDYRPERTWRHLDILGYNSYLYCRVPTRHDIAILWQGVKNSLGNVVSIPVPWADDDGRHTKKFDDYAIKVLKATHNQTKV